jgi:dipeptidyl aminopeptidase/acylaminoacyl peptidase
MQPVTAADYHDLALPSDPRLAPDGETVAFVRSVPIDDEAYAATVYLVSSDGGAVRRFTSVDGDDSEPRFSPSGDRLAFISTRRGHEDRTQLWVAPTDGGEARQVTTVAGAVSDIAWSPDGDRIAFIQQVSADDRDADRDLAVPEDFESADPDPRVIDRTVYRSAREYFDGQRSHVYLATLGDDTPDTADEISRLTDGDTGFASPAWGDEETLYYAESVGEDPDDSLEFALVAQELASGESERIHRFTSWTAALAASRDGRVAYLRQAVDQASLRPTEVHVLDRETGEVADATAGLDRSVGSDAPPQWGPENQHLYVVAPDEGRVPVWRVHWKGGDPERVVSGGHVASAHVRDDRVAFVQSEWDYPGDVFRTDRTGGQTQRLTRLNAETLADRMVAEPEELRVPTPGDVAPTTPTGKSASDGTTVQGWLLLPPDEDDSTPAGDKTHAQRDDDIRTSTNSQYPLAVEVHGGPHAMWSTAGTMWHELQTLAARGYAVFWCNPRGSTGYGSAFAAAIEGDWGATTATDVLAGVDVVTERPEVDESTVLLTGGSFGGFQTAWLVGQTDRFDAAVAQRGVYELTGFYGSTDQAYKLVEGDFDATPWEDQGVLWDKSPVAACGQVSTPTLVLHSDADYRTPANTAELFHRGLRKHDVETRLVRYPREGHELSRSGEPGHVVDRIERLARWFDGYSDFHDAPRALDRPAHDGLSSGDGSEGDRDDGR